MIKKESNLSIYYQVLESLAFRVFTSLVNLWISYESISILRIKNYARICNFLIQSKTIKIVCG